MGISTTDAVKLLADGLALIYHEARHAQHLVRAGHMSATGWERLLSLPANRVEAWRSILAVRETAADKQTAGQAAERFEHRFGKSVANLGDLYANGHWKHAAAVGGHAWRGVTAAVAALRDAIERAEAGEIEIAAQSLVTARHNNGVVREKIAELDAAIAVQTGNWWQRPAST